MFRDVYENITEGDETWKALPVSGSTSTYVWDQNSTYINKPPFFEDIGPEPEEVKDIEGAYCLLHLGDSITTDHISPAGNIAKASPAAQYLSAQGVPPHEYNTYGSRRGNYEVMLRGTFANIRLVNKLCPKDGPKTLHVPSGSVDFIFDASQKYKQGGHDTIVLAGKDYGSGSSRDWAAKGAQLLGIRAIIAESFERIHRTNLVGMGVLPLQFNEGDSADSLGLTGKERFSISLNKGITNPGQVVSVQIDNGKSFHVKSRIDTEAEMMYYRHGGILPFVLRKLVAAKKDCLE
eukprot:GHVU01015955.1.p1 GENE.GHVU01015955.1~~GHVU01015955.1.p1  ORF type:complete len:292 (-),score=47.20 GHVU01015955.1:463-1338(-)